MKVSLNWLKEFVEIPVDARRLKADLVSIGLNAESFQAVGEDVVFDVEVTSNRPEDRKSTRLNSSHVEISYAVFCLKKKIESHRTTFIPHTHGVCACSAA